MIVHPDGRLEGTPEEILQFQQTRDAAPKIEPNRTPSYPHPYWSIYPIIFPQTTCNGITATGSETWQSWN